MAFRVEMFSSSPCTCDASVKLVWDSEVNNRVLIIRGSTERHLTHHNLHFNTSLSFQWLFSKSLIPCPDRICTPDCIS